MFDFWCWLNWCRKPAGIPSSLWDVPDIMLRVLDFICCCKFSFQMTVRNITKWGNTQKNKFNPFKCRFTASSISSQDQYSVYKCLVVEFNFLVFLDYLRLDHGLLPKHIWQITLGELDTGGIIKVFNIWRNSAGKNQKQNSAERPVYWILHSDIFWINKYIIKVMHQLNQSVWQEHSFFKLMLDWAASILADIHLRFFLQRKSPKCLMFLHRWS